MKLLPFDLEKALNGHPVCTRDGRKVTKIFDTGTTDECPIIAVYENEWDTFTRYGTSYPKTEDDSDLFLYQETKKYWVVVWVGDGELCSVVRETEEGAKQTAALMDTTKIIEFEL